MRVPGPVRSSCGSCFGLVALVLVAGGAPRPRLALPRDRRATCPDLARLDDYRPPLTSVVLDRDGRPIGEFFEERRRLVRLDEMPQHVMLAFVAGEDDTFFEHTGIDYALDRARRVGEPPGRRRDRARAASTITQQTVKSLLLSPERTLRPQDARR